ncbi:MAG: hypothetical protein QMC83_10205, partial [Thermodesulfovibrionales bacterium]|nr:hypothetical protein [Thermodesulfovibrionales bacterium]
ELNTFKEIWEVSLIIPGFGRAAFVCGWRDDSTTLLFYDLRSKMYFLGLTPNLSGGIKIVKGVGMTLLESLDNDVLIYSENMGVVPRLPPFN